MKKTPAKLALGLAVVVAAVYATTDTNEGLVTTTTVPSRQGGGEVTVSSLSRAHPVVTAEAPAHESPDIFSESAFFYPAAQEDIVAALYSKDGLRRMSVFQSTVQNKGALAADALLEGYSEGWEGEMTIDPDNITAVGDGDSWVTDLLKATSKQGTGKYTIHFKLCKQTTNGMTQLRFELLDGQVLSKLETTVCVFPSGGAGTMVTVQTRSHLNAALRVPEQARLILARRVIGDTARLLNAALSPRG